MEVDINYRAHEKREGAQREKGLGHENQKREREREEKRERGREIAGAGSGRRAGCADRRRS